MVATGDRTTSIWPCACVTPRSGHEVVADPLAAVDRAVALAAPTAPEVSKRVLNGRSALDVIANYTAFADLRRRL